MVRTDLPGRLAASRLACPRKFSVLDVTKLEHATFVGLPAVVLALGTVCWVSIGPVREAPSSGLVQVSPNSEPCSGLIAIFSYMFCNILLGIFINHKVNTQEHPNPQGRTPRT
jgi:hypothetical protein